jgi:hypothetical protein
MKMIKPESHPAAAGIPGSAGKRSSRTPAQIRSSTGTARRKEAGMEAGRSSPKRRSERNAVEIMAAHEAPTIFAAAGGHKGPVSIPDNGPERLIMPKRARYES